VAEVDPYDTLKFIAERLTKGEPVRARTVRDILSWFGQRRRGVFVVDRIRKELDANGLVTKPDFEGAYIDSEVVFALKEQQPNIVRNNAQSRNDESEDTSVIRIRVLKSANKTPISVSPNTSISEAMTIMVKHDFAQLPVMQGPKVVKGLFTVAELARAAAFGASPKEVRECMKPAIVIFDDTPFLAAVRDVVENNCVLVKTRDGTISGIVTQTDLSQQFQDMTEPFLLLSQIEKQVRKLIFDRCRLDEATFDATPKTTIESPAAAKLTFGAYQRALESEENWTKAKTAYNRKIVVEGLHAVREIRNDIMHFNADPQDEEKDSPLQTLRNFVALMESVLLSPEVGSEFGETK
jgi:CBS domain-containing protein